MSHIRKVHHLIHFDSGSHYHSQDSEPVHCPKVPSHSWGSCSCPSCPLHPHHLLTLSCHVGGLAPSVLHTRPLPHRRATQRCDHAVSMAQCVALTAWVNHTSVHWLEAVWVVSRCGLVQVSCYERSDLSLGWHSISLSLGKMPRNTLSSMRQVCAWHLKEMTQCFPEWLPRPRTSGGGWPRPPQPC